MVSCDKWSSPLLLKHGKGIEGLMIYRQFIRGCLFFSDGVSSVIKSVQSLQVLTALVYMIYNIESLYLKLKTMVLKEFVKLRMSILIPFNPDVKAGAQARPSSPPIPMGEILKKSWSAMLEFSSWPSRGVLNLPKNRQIRNTPHHENTTHHAKLKFADNSTISVG